MHNKEIEMLNVELEEVGAALEAGCQSKDETKHSKAVNEVPEEVRAFYRKPGDETTEHIDALLLK